MSDWNKVFDMLECGELGLQEELMANGKQPRRKRF